MDGEWLMNGQKLVPKDRIPKIRKLYRDKANRGLIILALLFFIVLLVIIYFQSNLSRLSAVQIENRFYVREDEILQVAGLQHGMPYFDINTEKVEQAVKTLPIVKDVQVKRKLPNGLIITLTEFPLVAYWMEDQSFFPVFSNGYIGEEEVKPDHVAHPILNGWSRRDGVEELSKELEQLTPEVVSLISEIVLTPSSIDPHRLTMYMVDGFEVVTSIRHFSQNVNWYPHIRDQLLAEGKQESIIYLLDSKWAEEPGMKGTGEEEKEGVGEQQDEN